MTGVKVKISGFHVKDGRIVKRPVKLSRPAQYAAKTRVRVKRGKR